MKAPRPGKIPATYDTIGPTSNLGNLRGARVSGRKSRTGLAKEVTVQDPSSSDRQRGQGTLLGRAVLAFWSDVAPEHEDGFNDWYTNEHLPERVGVPGFFRGRRYVRTDDSRAVQKYFTLYETESIATLSSAPYLERLDNPTPWTQKMVPLFLNSNRLAYAIGASIGGGIGGWMATVEFGP